MAPPAWLLPKGTPLPGSTADMLHFLNVVKAALWMPLIPWGSPSLLHRAIDRSAVNSHTVMWPAEQSHVSTVKCIQQYFK